MIREKKYEEAKGFINGSAMLGGECGGTLENKLITQEFEREGIKVKLSGMKAWVC